MLGPVPLIVAESLGGFIVGQTLNSWVMVAMKKKTQGRFLVGRLVGSTLVGELADTFIFCAVASPIIGIETMGQFLNYALVGYFYKCAVEVLLMPITVPVIGWFKRHEPTYRLAEITELLHISENHRVNFNMWTFYFGYYPENIWTYRINQ